jgi:hypothetical protein
MLLNSIKNNSYYENMIDRSPSKTVRSKKSRARVCASDKKQKAGDKKQEVSHIKQEASHIKQKIKFQTKSDKRCEYYKTFRDAYNAYLKDNTIWKISFDIDEKNYRFRPKVKGEYWAPTSEEKIASLNGEYKIAKKNTIFWIDQKVIAPNTVKLYQDCENGIITIEERDRLFNLGCITSVYTVSQFESLIREIDKSNL